MESGTITSEQAREQFETLDASDLPTEDRVPGGWQPGDDPELAPEGAFLGTTALNGQIGLLPDTCAVKFAGTVGVEGGQLKMGERIRFTAEAIVSGDNTSGKVKNEGLEEPRKVQTATVINAERIDD